MPNNTWIGTAVVVISVAALVLSGINLYLWGTSRRPPSLPPTTPPPSLPLPSEPPEEEDDEAAAAAEEADVAVAEEPSEEEPREDSALLGESLSDAAAPGYRSMDASQQFPEIVIHPSDSGWSSVSVRSEGSGTSSPAQRSAFLRIGQALARSATKM